jgi:transcriptional regulator with XRE-family HTH domain
MVVRDWRLRRHRSQMDLAHEVGVSPRHLSFVETGRAKASPELLLALAEHLEVPLRERNGLLLASGYAPRYRQSSLDAPEMARVRQTLQRILDGHDPYPGVVIDRSWNVVLANRGAAFVVQGLPDHVVGPPLNVFRLCLHPDGLASRTLNFDEWSTYLLTQLHRSRVLSEDPAFETLSEEVMGYPNLAALGDWRQKASTEEPEILVPLCLASAAGELSLFTTVTVFGTPQDITLAELAIELFYPADDASEAMLRAAASPSLPNG